MADICRICLDATEDLLSIAKVRNDAEIEMLKLGMMFEECFDIEIGDTPDYLLICMGCKIQLTYYYNFKQKALQSHQKLLDLKSSIDSEVESESVDTLNDTGLTNQDKQIEVKIETELEDSESRNSQANDELCINNNALSLSEFELDVEYLEEAIDHLQAEHLGEMGEEEDLEVLSINVKLDAGNSIEDNFEKEKLQDTIESGDYEFEDCQMVKTSSQTIDAKSSSKKSLSSRDKFHCDLCGKNFRTLQVYTGHLNVHRGLPAYYCKMCKKNFKFKGNYDYHMKNHNNNRSFKCAVCSKSCLSKWDLQVHMRAHLNIRPYTCELCGKSFRVHSHMVDHMETHNEQNTYECPTCFHKYKTKASLKSHLNTIHIRSTHFDCSHCGKVFYRKHHLTTHQKVHYKLLAKNANYT